jgi:DNA polymerase-3 subunit delta'
MQGFQAIVGHDRIKESFYHAIRQKQVSHAYILEGEDGSGRMMLARAFAMTLLCERGGDEPCGECHSCLQFASDNHPDVRYVTHEKASISVDDIRSQVVGDAPIKPYSSAYKIYIIPEAEKMTVQAQNALLKTLEEPPEYVVIVLITSNADAFLPTIRSRCILLSCKPLADRAVKDYLMKVRRVPEEEADVCTAFARGNLGRAIQLSGSEDFTALREKVLYLLKNVKEMDISRMQEILKDLKETADIPMCIDLMQLWYRDVLMFKATKDMNHFIFKDEFHYIRKTAEQSDFTGLEKILRAMDKAKSRLDANVNFELAMELMLLTMKEN